MKSDFNFFVGIDSDELEKAADKTRKTGRYDNMTIQGVASDSSIDTDEEILEPNGFELGRFLKMGYINYDHQLKNSSKFAIGEPIEAKITDNKFHVKANLYKENPIARDLWDTMIMLKKSGSKRKVGFSIEGKALERHPQNQKRITKALITGLAATMNPKNGNSYADIVKGEYKESYIKEYDYTDESLEKSNQETNGGIAYLIDITDKETGIRYTVDKDLNLKVEKAMSTETAKPLIKESLERKLKVLPFGATDINNVARANKNGQISDILMKKVQDKVKKSLNVDIDSNYNIIRKAF